MLPSSPLAAYIQVSRASVTVGAMVGCGVGSIAGAPGAVIGMCVGAAGYGTAGGYFGICKISSWLRKKLGKK